MLLAVAGAVVALAAAAAVAPAAGGARTERVVFFPFRGSLVAPGIHIERSVRGSCSYGSEFAARWDAWSCTAGGRRYDPCFSGRRTGVGAQLVCMDFPWANATLLELTRPVPDALANVVGDPRTHAPWALTLATGERCALVRSRLGTIGGEPIKYACAGSAVLAGLPARGRPVWTIKRAATATAKARSAAIRRAWW
jgi:hypothetical protein